MRASRSRWVAAGKKNVARSVVGLSKKSQTEKNSNEANALLSRPELGHIMTFIPKEKTAFTRVLQGMIAMSRARFPKGLAGRDLDVLARYPLWLADQDFAHGTGHGVGVHLCVHEGPQRLSRTSHVPLKPGMILSNEPGYYREGAFGIRIENLLVVQKANPLEGGDPGDRYCFETLSYVPIDLDMVQVDMLSNEERAWLNTYHAACRDKLTSLLSPDASEWLQNATRPL